MCDLLDLFRGVKFTLVSRWLCCVRVGALADVVCDLWSRRLIACVILAGGDSLSLLDVPSDNFERRSAGSISGYLI